MQIIVDNYNNRKGFTLIELMIALAIIFISMTAILSFISRYQVINIENNMRDEARFIAQNQLEQYRNASVLPFGETSATQQRKFRNIDLTYTVASTIQEVATTAALAPDVARPTINPAIMRYTQTNTGPITLYEFVGATEGQRFCVEILSAGNTRFDFSSGSSNLTGTDGIDYGPAARYDILCFVQEGTKSRRIASSRGSIAVRVGVTWQHRGVNHQYSASTIISRR
jgi:prepilin-type N-terminal cleavage/methylation domain-containing protein